MRFLILFGVGLMVWAIAPALYDSTNIPKYSLLFVTASLVLPQLFHPRLGLLQPATWRIWLAPFLFITTMFILALTSQQKYMAFFGQYGRNNGWLEYLCLTVLLLAAAFTFTLKTAEKFIVLTAYLGLGTAIYGLFQYHNIDFIKYTNRTLPIIGTLGNSDFASALMGLAAVASLWKVIVSPKRYVKIFYICAAIFDLYVIKLSIALQGIFTFLAGSAVLIGLSYFRKRDFKSFTYYGALLVGLILTILGLLQKGPLSHVVYKASTSARGDFYRAAWRMFTSHPLRGVGIDQFGNYYRSYRDSQAALRPIGNSVTQYAHNTFLQLLATGGIFLLLAYLSMLFFVGRSATQAYICASDSEKKIIVGLCSIWVGYLVQAQVSIDELSIASIGWVAAGALLALGFNKSHIQEISFTPNTSIRRRRASLGNRQLAALACTLVLLIAALFHLVPVWKSDYEIRSANQLSSQNQNPAVVAKEKYLALLAIKNAPKEIAYKVQGGFILTFIGSLESARQQLKAGLLQNPKSYDSLEYIAQVYEKAGLPQEGAKSRILMSSIDKYDLNNWLLLAKDLKQIGDMTYVKKIITIVNNFAPQSDTLTQLKALV